MPSATTSATASLTAQPPVFAAATTFATASMAGLQYSSFSPPEVYTPRFVTTLTADILTGLRPTTISVAATQAVFGNGTFSVAIYDVGTDADPVNFEAFEILGGATSLDWTAVTESGWTPTIHLAGSTVVATVLTPRSITQPLNNHISTLSTPDPHPLYIRKSSFNTRGDLLVGTGGNGQYLPLPAAADGQVLLTDSTRQAGVRWSPFSISSVLTHMGDLVVGGLLGVAQRLGIGTVGQFLTIGQNAPAVQNPSVGPTVTAVGSGGLLVNGTNYDFAYAWQTPNASPDGGITLPSPITQFTATTSGVAQVQTPACPVAGGTLIVYAAVHTGTLTQQAVLTPASTTSVNLVQVATIGGGTAVAALNNTTGGIGPQWRSLAGTDFPTNPLFNGEVTATDFRASGFTGSTAQGRFLGSITSGPPVAGTFQAGDYLIDLAGTIWICTVGGLPGTWVRPFPYTQSSFASSLFTSGTISTAGLTAIRVLPSSPVTGVTLQAGTLPGQVIAVINESTTQANSITFSPTGNVADGTSCVIPGLTQRIFVWNSGTSLWYEQSSGSVGVFGASGTSHSTGLVPDPGSVAGTTRFLREDSTWVNIYNQSASATAITTGGTITTSGVTTARVAPTTAVTGIIMQQGTYAGQRVAVVNESAAGLTVTFAASSSNVAGAAGDVLPGATAAIYTWDSGTNLWYGEASGVIGTIDIALTGGGSALTTGIKGDFRIDHSMQIIGWSIYADQVGSVQFDIWQSSHSTFPPTVANTIIGAGTKPIMSSTDHSAFSNLTSWTTAIAAGTILRVNIDSVATITRVTLALQIVRTS